MGEIKSAFEKAMEKVEKLGKLSPEEVRQDKEAEYTPVGRALADRYLGHGYIQIFREEMGKYSGDGKDIVVRAALSRLVEAISLGSDKITERATEGVLTLKENEKVREMNEEIRGLCSEYKKGEQQEYDDEKEEIERQERELLHQLRISGEAVGEINLKVSEAWKKTSGELYLRFDERLSELKRELLNI